jgi:hypothetical protein
VILLILPVEDLETILWRLIYPLHRFILNTGARMLEYTHWQMRNIGELRELASDPEAELHPTKAGEY